MQCEGTIPERTVPTGSEMVNVAAEGEEERYERRIAHETIPEHRCEAEATMLARSMAQRLCSFGEPHWVKDGPDRAYCAACFRPGRVTDLAGNTSLHPAMSIDEYQGARP